MMLNTIYKKIDYHLRYGPYRLEFLAEILPLLPGFICMHIKQTLKVLPKGRKTILFIMDEEKLYSMGDGNNRYIWVLLNRFDKAGYNIYFYRKVDLKTYYRLQSLGRMTFELKNVKVITKEPKNTNDIIFAFDRVDNDLLKRRWKKLVFVNTFKPPFCRVGDVEWISYTMFPYIYNNGLHKKLDTFRKNKRKMKMLFGGNTSRKYYNNPKLRDRYGLLTRIEGVQALEGLGDKTVSHDSREQFIQLLNMQGYTNTCRIMHTTSSFPMSPVEWLSLLSFSDFFVCLSGTDTPMCHNAVESMAVGTIPIIAYADWFFPALEHGKNAIVYSGRYDLIKKVKEVFDMPQEKILEMRVNVIDYYEKYLSNESFIRRFEANRSDLFTLMLHPRLVCSPEENEKGKKLLEELQRQFGTDTTQAKDQKQASVT